MYFSIFCLTALSIIQRAHSHAASSNDSSKPLAIGWYAGWHATTGFPLSSISWDKYTTLVYAFAVTTPSASSVSLNGSNPYLLPDFVSEAHKHNVSAHASFGGWSGSKYFSDNVATAENRTAFVKTVVEFAQQYKLDGLAFDWEYPNGKGVGCNTLSADDTQNFLLFLQELRSDAVGAKLTLSAATPVVPFLDASGKPTKDVSGFAKVLDYITIMNYDVWGAWSGSVGPNAPLDDTCATAAQQQGSAVSALKAWTAAGMTADKIVLGVPAYGHSFSVLASDVLYKGSNGTELRPYPVFNSSNQPLGDAWDNVGGVDTCGVYQKSGGIFTFWGLVDALFLNKKGNPKKGIYYRYDDCSQTPYVYNATSQVMISFDDARSFSAKGKFIKDNGLAGFGLWEVGGDYHDILLTAIRGTAGFDDC